MNFLSFAMLFALVGVPLWGAAPSTPDDQPRRPRNVAILVYEGMEILDFAGPSEVFQASGDAFKTYTVGLNRQPVLSQRFVTITPGYTIDDAPPPDILVVPGGNSDNVRKNPEFMKWVSDAAGHAEIVLTVCTGAFVIADTHMLDGLDTTTWYGAIDGFRSEFPKTRVHEHVRFVDNGKFITTAGVSAGIDGALHVVAKLAGDGAARTTAKYMEYDKWDASAGLVIPSDANKKYQTDADARAEALLRSAVPAVDEGGAQAITVAVTEKGFEPSVVSAKAGVPIRVTFERRASSSCVNAVKIPTLDVPATPVRADGKTVVNINPARPGTYEFTCGMDMVRGILIVNR